MLLLHRTSVAIKSWGNDQVGPRVAQRIDVELVRVADNLNEPIAALPLMIYYRATSPYEDFHRQAWAAGLVLLVLVLIANIASRWVLSRGTSVQRG